VHTETGRVGINYITRVCRSGRKSEIDAFNITYGNIYIDIENAYHTEFGVFIAG
jgi:hypothetical protein